uniref:Uncharacterized protein n=1 Tax=Arundo donax TaxID=35708 RepID=A0A0A9DU46_ARUDO
MAAVSVWRTIPTLWPAATRRRTWKPRRKVGTLAVRKLRSGCATMPSTAAATAASSPKKRKR